MREYKKIISPKNGFPKASSILIRPEKIHVLKNIKHPLIARGSGSNPTDGSLHENHHVLLMERFNRFLDFNDQTGVLRAESGVTIGEIHQTFIPRGWFLPVFSRSLQSTLGGCVATDTRSCNHHLEGSFSQHVESIEILLGTRESVRCSQKEEQDIFRATVGSMGLTGIIKELDVRLKPIETAYIAGKRSMVSNFDQLFEKLLEVAKEEQYVHAWVDCFSNGRGVVFGGHHASLHELPKKIEEPLKASFNKLKKHSLSLPAGLIHTKAKKLFHSLCYHLQSRMPTDFVSSISDFFFTPRIDYWSSKKGSISYEFFIPKQTAHAAMTQVIDAMAQSNLCPSGGYLQVCGKASDGFFSFAREGYSFEFSLPFKDDSLFHFLNKIDKIVMEHAGQVNIAKDIRLSPQHFQSMYTQLTKWQAIKRSIDPENFFQSNLSKRLAITERETLL